MQRNLCKGNILQTMLLFALPMMAGNLLQQIYNIADTLIVGRCLGADALAAVKIDTIAYMPAQEFANAYSMFLSQNYGAGENDRIRKGTRLAVRISVLFCVAASLIVCGLARPLMLIFVDSSKQAILDAGVRYLRIEGAFYWGIGCLFLLYGLYRGIGRPGMSLVLTVISLGTRVALAYLMAPNPAFGVTAIWWAIPAGWILADLTGYLYYVIRCRLPIKKEHLT